MTHWQSGDIRVNGLMLHYTRTGGAKPPVVLAHGFSDDGLCWTPVAEALEAELRCRDGGCARSWPFGRA